MKKDIEIPEVTGVKVAVAKSLDQNGESEWRAYLINENLIDLEQVMITTKGYEKADGSGRKTSILRHVIQGVAPQSYAIIERVQPTTFGFYNEFWVSFYILNELFDKKFVLPPFLEFDVEIIDTLELPGKLAH